MGQRRFPCGRRSCIVLSDKVTRKLAGSRRLERLAQRIGGGVLIIFGINLAVSRQ